MPNDNAIKFGILKTRDLVELWYGARMVVQVRATLFNLQASTVVQILQPDPRRIRYEIVFENFDPGPATFDLGTQAEQDSGNTLEYQVPTGASVVVTRTWLDDLEGVTLEQTASTDVANTRVGVRETILTPIPVDEMP